MCNIGFCLRVLVFIWCLITLHMLEFLSYFSYTSFEPQLQSSRYDLILTFPSDLTYLTEYGVYSHVLGNIVCTIQWGICHQKS